MEYHNNKLLVSFKNQWHAFWPVIMIAFLMIGGLYWYNFSKASLIGFGIMFSLDFFPTLFLHWQYLRKNKGEDYEVLFDRIILYKDGNRTEYLVSEMMLINIMLSPALYKKSNFHFLGIEAYYFACIYMKNGYIIL